MDKDIMKAFQKAYDCDPISAFGGIYGFSTEVTETLAKKVTENFVEIVLAPSYEKSALDAFEGGVCALRAASIGGFFSVQLFRICKKRFFS